MEKDMNEELDEQEVDEIEEEESGEKKKHKFTDWENEPKVSDFQYDHQEAQPYHKEHTTTVDKYIKNLNGELHVAIPKNRSQMQPKLIRKQAEWRYAALSEPFLSTSDLFEIEPVTSEDVESAEQNSFILNNQFQTKINKVNFIDEYVRAVVDEGSVVIKVEWETIEEISKVEVEQPVYASPEESLQILQQQIVAGELSQEEAQLMVQSGSPVQIGTEWVTEERNHLVKNQPKLEVCDYNNVIIDPTCNGDLENASFIIYKFTTSLSNLEKDGRYANLDRIGTNDGNPLAEPDFKTSAPDVNFADKPRQKLVAYEYWGYWDIHKTGMVEPIVATYIGDVMIRLEENPFPDKKLPFVLVNYLPKRKQIYGEPDGVLTEDNQKTVGAITRGMIDVLARSANAQQGIRKDALDVVQQRKFESGEDYYFNPNVNPDQAFHMGKYPELPRSALDMITLQNQDAESLTGVKSFSSGISGQALGSTATGIRSALDATSKRELGILRRLSKGIVEIGRKIISMNAEFLSEEEVVRITNDEFVTIRRDDLAGNFDLRLSISTAESDNEKAQELSFMLQTLGNNQDPEITKMIQVEIAKLRKMPALAKQLEEYTPQPDPMAVKRAELEIALLEAKVQNERAKGAENAADVALKQAKTDTELAKGGKLTSEKDLNNLDFLEKESGRDVGKQIDLKHAESVLANMTATNK